MLTLHLTFTSLLFLFLMIVYFNFVACFVLITAYLQKDSWINLQVISPPLIELMLKSNMADDAWVQCALRFGLAGWLFLESWINDSISFKSWDEYIEEPKEHKAARGNSFHCVLFWGLWGSVVAKCPRLHCSFRLESI